MHQLLDAFTKWAGAVVVHGLGEGDDVSNMHGSCLVWLYAVVDGEELEVRKVGGVGGVEARVDDGDGEASAAEAGGELEHGRKMALERRWHEE